MGLIEVKLLSSNAKLPTYGTAQAAGADLYADQDVTIPRHSYAAIPIGMAIAMPPNCWAQIAPRSGLALQQGIMVMGGVIDSDYRGEIKVILYNAGGSIFHVTAGMRIAQLIVHSRPWQPEFHAVTDLAATERADKGFGSTGT